MVRGTCTAHEPQFCAGTVHRGTPSALIAALQDPAMLPQMQKCATPAASVVVETKLDPTTKGGAGHKETVQVLKEMVTVELGTGLLAASRTVTSKQQLEPSATVTTVGHVEVPGFGMAAPANRAPTNSRTMHVRQAANRLPIPVGRFTRPWKGVRGTSRERNDLQAIGRLPWRGW